MTAPRPVGRPPTGAKPSLTVRLPAALIARMRTALDKGESLSQFATAALTAECERREVDG